MLIHISAVLTPDEVKACRAALEAGRWIDGRGSAGHMAATAKDNHEADLTDPAVRARYDELYRSVYRPMYGRLQPLYRELRRITAERDA